MIIYLYTLRLGGEVQKFSIYDNNYYFTIIIDLYIPHLGGTLLIFCI